jgi:hypothetical protein
MNNVAVVFLALSFSSFSFAACESAREPVSSDLQNTPIEEMQRQDGRASQDCVSAANFIARNSRAKPATPSASNNVNNKPAASGSSNRFNMTQNGKKMTADDFDAWMRANGIRVVGGKAPDPAPAPVVACKPTKKKPCPKSKS